MHALPPLKMALHFAEGLQQNALPRPHMAMHALPGVVVAMQLHRQKTGGNACIAKKGLLHCHPILAMHVHCHFGVAMQPHYVHCHAHACMGLCLGYNRFARIEFIWILALGND
jgi:hypothetical protein